jgi:hypothetical protein
VRCRGSVRPGCARTGVSNHWATTTERASRFQPPRSCGSDAESPWLPVMRTKIDGLRTVTHTYQLTTFSRKRKLGRARAALKANRATPSITPDNLLPKAQSGLVIFDPRPPAGASMRKLYWESVYCFSLLFLENLHLEWELILYQSSCFSVAQILECHKTKLDKNLSNRKPKN